MKEWQKILVAFLIWRVGLFLVAKISPNFLPKFGSQFPYYNSDLAISHLPEWIWSFANFDGVHYVRASVNGYSSQYSQAFFPLFILIIKDLSIFMTPVLAGLILSNLFFLFGLIIFYKLLRIDFDQNISWRTILFLLCLPTSFYFGAVYTESLFFFLTVSSLWYIRQDNLFHSGLLTLLASATRIIGLLLFPVILWQLYQGWRKKKLKLSNWEGKKALVGALIAPFGLIFYMVYLNTNFGDPLYFLNAQPEFGAQRSAQPFILLPQVFYRYFKILISVPLASQAFFNGALELSFTTVIIVLLIISFKKTRKDYWFFSAAVLLLPTLTGTLSSMPRYSLMAFLIFPIVIMIIKRNFWWIISFLALSEVILTTIFIRGYWIA